MLDRVPPSPSHRRQQRDAWIAFGTLFFILAGHAMLETARDALFLSELPAERLPIAYLAITVLVALVSRFNNGAAERFRRRPVIAATSVAFAAMTLGFWWLLTSRGTLLLYAFYVWTGLVATVLVVQFWGSVSGLFSVDMAKHVYARIGLGAVLGATLGSAGARVLLTRGAPVHLLIASAGCLLVAAGGPLLMSREIAAPLSSMAKPDPPTRRQGKRYLHRVWWLVVTAAMTVTVVDFVFKSVVAARVGPESLGAFFATYYTVTNGIALGVQLLLAPWLLRRLGVNRALLIMPALLLGAGLGFVLSAGLLAAIILKGAEGSLLHSVNRTGLELLYVPLPTRLREHFKTFIDGVGQRLGQALASLGILAATSFGATADHLGWVVCALALVWMVAAAGMRPHYLRMVRRKLGAPRAARALGAADPNSPRAS